MTTAFNNFTFNPEFFIGFAEICVFMYKKLFNFIERELLLLAI